MSSEHGFLCTCLLGAFTCSATLTHMSGQDEVLKAGIWHSSFSSLQICTCQPLISSILQMRSSMHPSMLLLQVVDEGKKRAIQIEKEGFPDAVVWNPWIEKAAGMADFGNDEYKVKPLSFITCSIDVTEGRGADLLCRRGECRVQLRSCPCNRKAMHNALARPPWRGSVVSRQQKRCVHNKEQRGQHDGNLPACVGWSSMSPRC